MKKLKTVKPLLKKYLCLILLPVSFYRYFLAISFFLAPIINCYSQVGISYSSITPDPSSILELRSTSAGFLAPRMTTAQRNSIPSPATGLLIYNTSTSQFNSFDGSIWQVLTNGTSVTSLNGNTGALTMDTNYISNFSTKVRSLFSSTAPITYGNGLIGITQANTSTNGYLSSADWNTFNSKQPSGNYLLDPGGNGVVVRTALNTSINRVITGTANRITLNNGDGVSGNPTIDISSSYAGQSSITTLGTITTGTWNGTKISEAYGGTNQSTYATGDILYASAANTLSKLAANATATKKYLQSVSSGAPSWQQIDYADLSGNTDTSAIPNFSVKTRSLFSGTAPITYSNGTIGITQAGSSSNGYLSSSDWNTFNNKQPAGNYLLDPGGNGVVVRTALNTSINRVITGTANRITLSNGDGVSGNPTIDISSSYAGQSSITTLGTITTGTWNGSVIDIAHGGTNSSTALNNNRLMVSSGGKIVEGSALTNGQLFIGSTGAAPVAANLTAGNGISISNSAGSITVTNSKPGYKTLVTSASADILLTTTTITDITGLSFTAAANTTYHIHALIAFTSIDAGTGMDVGCEGPASPTFVALQGTSTKNSNTTFNFNETGLSQPSSQVSNGSIIGTNIAILEGVITTGASGGTIIVSVDASKASKITVNTSLCSLEYW